MISRELLQILAKKGRVEIIRTLKAFPEGDFSINELSRVAKVPTMTAWRGVRELKAAGFVRTRKVGNSISVRISDDREKLRVLRQIPDTDPQRSAARRYTEILAKNRWLKECRLFGSIGRGEHSPGDEVDVAVIYDDASVGEAEAKDESAAAASQVKSETNVVIAPLCVPHKDMARKGGLAAELRDKEIVWFR